MALVALALATAVLATPAAAQVCSYSNLVDDTPAPFNTSPTMTRFVQADGRWAAVAVQSSGSANWDIGLSVGAAPFAACVTPPVVTSTQGSGIDFVLGDFAAEGTGTRYAPIGRASGTGLATVEWDSGSRMAVVGPALHGGLGSSPGLIDVWNIDLVAGTSYRIGFRSNNLGEYKLFAFKRGAGNSWRSKADALVEVVTNASFPPILTATTTDRYAFVVERQVDEPFGYTFTVQECVDPPHLEPHVSLVVPPQVGIPDSPFQFEQGAPGFPTIAARAGQDGDWFWLMVAKHVEPGYYPCEGVDQANSGASGERVALVVGDMVSGAIPPGGSYWIGARQSSNVDGRIEYSPGTDVIAVDGPTLYKVGGNDMVVRTYRADLVAGNEVRFHIAKCGPATGMLRVFRPFDATVPLGNGWSSPNSDHGPLAEVLVTGVNDFTFNPPVTGAYAVVLTNETGENHCWELGISTCRARIELFDGSPQGIAAVFGEPYAGDSYGTLHGRFGWSAVAVLPNALTEDWVIEAWDAPTAGDPAPPFGCLWNRLGASTDDGTGSRLDFLARYDTPAPPLQEWVETQYVYPAAGTSPGQGGQVEFEMHNTTLAVGDFVNSFPLGHLDFMEVWNIELVAGQPYAVHFQPVAISAELFIMKSLLAATSTCTFDCPPEYLALGGPGQVLRTAGPTVFTPTESGIYGLIVAYQGPAAGSVSGKFSLALNPTVVGAETLPAVTRFGSAAPNPLRGQGTRFSFELAQEAEVAFEVVNIAGRVVARVPARTYPAGPGLAAWEGRDADGARIAPGIYFVRMRVAGAVAGGGKLIAM